MSNRTEAAWRKLRHCHRENLQSMAPVLDPTTHRRPDATRKAPAVILIRINWQLARDRPGRVGGGEVRSVR
jgi:hypothetical protein